MSWVECANVCRWCGHLCTWEKYWNNHILSLKCFGQGSTLAEQHLLTVKCKKKIEGSNVFLNGAEIELVSHFKYLGVILDSNLTFKKHIKKVSNTIKFNLQNVKLIRPFLTVNAAKSYLHSMILSHIEYCFTNWLFACATNLKPIEQLYKRAIKVFDRRLTCYRWEYARFAKYILQHHSIQIVHEKKKKWCAFHNFLSQCKLATTHVLWGNVSLLFTTTLK